MSRRLDVVPSLEDWLRRVWGVCLSRTGDRISNEWQPVGRRGFREQPRLYQRRKVKGPSCSDPRVGGVGVVETEYELSSMGIQGPRAPFIYSPLTLRSTYFVLNLILTCHFC